jgi:hypothetical protein
MSPSRVALTAHLSTGVERRESENILLDGRRQDMGFAGSIHDLLQTVSVVNWAYQAKSDQFRNSRSVVVRI